MLFFRDRKRTVSAPRWILVNCGVALILQIGAATQLIAETDETREWPFYAPTEVSVPSVENESWPRNEIDRFVLHKLEQKQLRPSKAANRQTLIRRLYFDLIGLPPSSKSVTSFVNDPDKQAYEKLVDQLLNDKRYGEHWARLWLDLARYADTAGYEGDPDLPHAWRYRDYVIDAFNNDKPYDLFIREQLAGDEFDEIMGAGDLPGTPAERVVAMTFLRLAPFTEPRGDETRHEMLSEITSTVGSVFLGLTVGCAKCHDHKHDEISTVDFYRMKAFFSTVQIPRPEPGDIYQIGGSINASFYRDGEKDWAASLRQKLKKQASDAGAEVKKLQAAIRDRVKLDFEGSSGFGIQTISSAGNDYNFAEQAVHEGEPHLSIVNSDGSNWSIYTDGQQATLGSMSGMNRGKWFESIAAPQHISLGQHAQGKGEPQGSGHQGSFAEILIYDHPLDQAAVQQLSAYANRKYGISSETSADAAATDQPPQSGLRFWLDASDLDGKADTMNPPAESVVSAWVDRVSGIQIKQAQANLQPTLTELGPHGAAAVQFDNGFLVGNVEKATFLRDQQGAIVIVYSASHTKEGYGFEVGGNDQFLTTFINPAASTDGDPVDALIQSDDPRVSKDERRQYEFWKSRDRFVKHHLKRLQPVAMSLRHSYGPPYEPGVPTSRVMVRGEYDNPGEVVEAGFLSVITENQDSAPIRLDPFKRWPTRSRRMALAAWIANPQNPMTHRVMVNRLWHSHFGQGIVRTPSDFGYLSDGASHEELLDWLALRFVENKWSIKAIHRLIVNSSTYRQESTQRNKQAELIDPDNRLLWRFNRRRLRAEEIRDNVLFVSGRLNPEQFGLPIFPPLPGDVADAVKYSESKWDTQHGPEGRKRSLYIYQQRTLSMPFLQTFDALVCSESLPRRRTSVTPLQALAMYNGDLVNEETEYFAQRVMESAGSDINDQIKFAFETALGRAPTPTEFAQLQQLFTTTESPQLGLQAVCRVLYNMNEFVFID